LRAATVEIVMTPIGPALLAALPIREQQTTPPETGLNAAEAAFFALVLVALLAIGSMIVAGRRSRRARAFEESRAWVVMDELCREGWTAQLTLYGSGAPLPGDSPDLDRVRVRLDWAELASGADGKRGPAVERRLWARTVAGALSGMVADRRLDLELEEIERARPGRGSE
jgi:hypothetical protein